MLPRLSVLAACLALVLVETAGPGEPGKADAAIRATEAALRSEGAAGLREVLPGEKKVYLAVPAVHEPEGFLGADQVFYLLRSFVSSHPTRAFSIDRACREPSRSSIVCAAEWRYASEEGKDRSEPLQLTFAQETDRWVLIEIRAAGS